MSTEWRPIATAPTDGTPVLVAGVRRVWISSRKRPSGRAPRDGYGPFDGYDWHLMEAGTYPTHWMPLPEPPTPGDTHE